VNGSAEFQISDLSAILVIALIAAGIILLLDALLLKRKRLATGHGATAQEPVLVSYARSFFPVLLVVVLVRSFLFEPFRIPSASMMPALVDGDFILVNKFSYGLRLPLLHTKFLAIGEPRRGDVIVFRLPSDPSTNFIKRLVGLPGDHIRVRDNRIFINGAAVTLTLDGTYSGDFGFAGSPLGLERLGQSAHLVMFAPTHYAADFEGIVPAEHYFFRGDNRNDSEDSRFQKVGFVSDEYLVGRAVRIWMNWRLPGWPDWRRIGMRVQ
jgi:signal peptidase I